MRLYYKNQLLELVKTIGECHQEMKKHFKSKFFLMHEYLELCWQAMQEISNTVEALGQTSDIINQEIQNYCEFVQDTRLTIGQASQINNIHKILSKKLMNVRQTLITEIEVDSFEVFFLPYKASMWDSMQSVYEAAVQDDKCNAYVMPIPYCEKNMDGTFTNMQYEGNLYPNDVPIVYWEDIDLEKWHPDAIFIHNPYDDTNLLTSVHPNYYTERLKECSPMVVYIPYFVSHIDVNQNFCLSNGVFYADKVILQSKDIRSIYLKHIQQFLKSNKEYGEFKDYENKILALGSPKFDNLIRFNDIEKWNLDLPDSWRNLICAGETRKKVILFNTHLSALFAQNAEKFIRKLINVLEVFKSRKDIVLLWRPHPFSMETASAMNPAVLNQYMDVVKQYQLDGWGIYDDTPDLHRAIALSDGYYGDFGSILALYLMTGKPLMIQNRNIFEYNF